LHKSYELQTDIELGLGEDTYLKIGTPRQMSSWWRRCKRRNAAGLELVVENGGGCGEYLAPPLAARRSRSLTR
jgi:hypothetical protein